MKRRGPENVHHLSDGGSSASIFGSRGCRADRWARPRLAALAGGRSCYPALQPADFRRQLPVRGVAQKSVDTPLVLDRADRRGGNAQMDGAEDIRKDRGALQVRQVAPLRLVVGMADIVADLDALPGDCASPCHGTPQPNPNLQRLTQPALRPLLPNSAAPGQARARRPAIDHPCVDRWQRLHYAAMTVSNALRDGSDGSRAAAERSKFRAPVRAAARLLIFGDWLRGPAIADQ